MNKVNPPNFSFIAKKTLMETLKFLFSFVKNLPCPLLWSIFLFLLFLVFLFTLGFVIVIHTFNQLNRFLQGWDFFHFSLLDLDLIWLKYHTLSLYTGNVTRFMTLWVRWFKLLIKVSKFQKQIFLFSFEPKYEPNFFLNSALASKMSQMKAYWILGIYFLMTKSRIISFGFWFKWE